MTAFSVVVLFLLGLTGSTLGSFENPFIYDMMFRGAGRMLPPVAYSQPPTATGAEFQFFQDQTPVRLMDKESAEYFKVQHLDLDLLRIVKDTFGENYTVTSDRTHFDCDSLHYRQKLVHQLRPEPNTRYAYQAILRVDLFDDHRFDVLLQKFLHGAAGHPGTHVVRLPDEPDTLPEDLRLASAATLEFAQTDALRAASPRHFVFASLLLVEWPGSDPRVEQLLGRVAVRDAWQRLADGLRRQLRVNAFSPYLNYSVYALRMIYNPRSMFSGPSSDLVLMLLARQPAGLGPPPAYDPCPPYCQEAVGGETSLASA